MKLFCCLGLLILLLGISPMQAQKMTIGKLGGTLLGLLDDYGGGDNGNYWGPCFSLEHQLGSKTSFSLNGNWNAHKETIDDSRHGSTYRRYAKTTIEPEFRYYFYSQDATAGFYLGGTIAIHFSKTQHVYTGFPTDKYLQFGAGLTTGYQFRLTPVLHLQIGGGLGVFLPTNYGNITYRYGSNLLLGYQW